MSHRLLLATFLAVRGISFGTAGQDLQHPPNERFQLARIIERAREYCRRLENSALDFVCVEEVLEKVDRSWDSDGIVEDRDPFFLLDTPSIDTRIKNRMLYDYQFVRRGGLIKETRRLFKGKDKKTNEIEVPLRTKEFHYADVLLAPVQLLDLRFQDFYHYRLISDGQVNGSKVWILEVSPVISVAGNYLGGNIWLEQEHSRVVKIDWDPRTFGNFETVLSRARKYKAEPCVSSCTEFGVEKNGLRFPSVDLTEEAYLSKKGRKFVRSQTRAIYKDYRFFTVETDIEVKQ